MMLKIVRVLISVCLIALISRTVSAQPKVLQSGVYNWDTLKTQTLTCATGTFDQLKIRALVLKSGNSVDNALSTDTTEELIIVKDGNLNVSINANTKLLGPGSVAVVMPGDSYRIKNMDSVSGACYVLKYRSRAPIDVGRGVKAGGSILVDWHDLVFKPHDKGGLRQYFERATAMLKRLDIHVTTLNAELKSHEPHTHGAEEVVLMIKGNAEMQIGDGFYQGTAGDLFYLASNIPHALKNTGTTPCMYYAIQWE
jgi:(S)-ureidoglycine aminohydrolase